MGSSAAASRVCSRSKAAPASVGSARQRSTARSQSAPLGERGRSARKLKVVSSGAIMPARAPASMDMLHTVMRSSMFSARIASPRYSSTCPVPPSTPIWPMIASTRSLAVTPGCSFWLTLMAKVCGLRCRMHCVASTCPTSVVPMRKGQCAEGTMGAGVTVAAGQWCGRDA